MFRRRLRSHGIAQVLPRIALLVGLCSATHAVSEVLEPGSVVTLAGTSVGGFNGDFLPDGARQLATTAQLYLPWGVAIDPRGRYVYVADAGNHRVRRINRRTGYIFTVAGNGSPDLRGDGGLATNASLQAPAGLAIDSDGNIYIADSGNHRIRRVDTNGLITTVAGGNAPGYWGDYGIATQAALSRPTDVAIGPNGDLYISDSGNHRIRKVANGIVTTIAGSGARVFEGDGKQAIEAAISPAGIAFDGEGRLLVADAHNHQVFQLDLLTGVITTIAGGRGAGFGGDGGLAIGAKLSSPSGVAVSIAGDVFIADSGNRRIRRIRLATGAIETVAGSGRATRAMEEGVAVDAAFWNPYGIALDAADNLYVADYLNHRLCRVNLRRSEAVGYIRRTGIGVQPSRGWGMHAGFMSFWPRRQNLKRTFSKDSDAEIISEPGVGLELILRREPQEPGADLAEGSGPRARYKTSNTGISSPELAWLILWPKSRPTSDTIAAGHNGFLMALFLGAKRPMRNSFLTGAIGFWFMKFSRNRYEDALDLNPGVRIGVEKHVGMYRGGDLLARFEYMPLKGPTYFLNTAIASLRFSR
jgi:DNA-binding beta-propeller fold protein YncE